MKSFTLFTSLFAFNSVLVLSTQALALRDCTKEPKEKWMSEESFKNKMKEEGYTISKFKKPGSCYEIYGKDKAGKKVEIYFNPVDASIVKEERD